MGATIDDLNDVTAAFLQVAQEALALTAAGTPARVFVSPGEPALDCCGQLTVWVQDLTDVPLQTPPGALGPSKSILRGRLPSAGIFVQVTRCSEAVMKWNPKGKDLPSPALLQKDAQMVDQDGWVLRLEFAKSIREGLLSRVCTGVELLGGQKLTPQGECIGWTFSFRYPIEGGRLS